MRVRIIASTKDSRLDDSGSRELPVVVEVAGLRVDVRQQSADEITITIKIDK